MPLNDRFYNPGSAATNALLDFLTQREATRRQAFLDDLKRQEFEQQKRATDQRIELDREQAAGLREQREAAADLNRQKKALGVMTMLEPDATIGAGTADTIREGGFGEHAIDRVHGLGGHSATVWARPDHRGARPTTIPK